MFIKKINNYKKILDCPITKQLKDIQYDKYIKIINSLYDSSLFILNSLHDEINNDLSEW